MPRDGFLPVKGMLFAAPDCTRQCRADPVCAGSF